MLIFTHVLEKDTQILGAKIARSLMTNSVQTIIHLKGELGAGKTTFVRSVLQALGFTGIVKSPTYSLIESYEINHMHILHLDLYRLENEHELDYIGFKDSICNNTITFIEWADKFNMNADLQIALKNDDNINTRNISMQAYSDIGNKILQQL